MLAEFIGFCKIDKRWTFFPKKYIETPKNVEKAKKQ
jgi:hypothetical protein